MSSHQSALVTLSFQLADSCHFCVISSGSLDRFSTSSARRALSKASSLGVIGVDPIGPLTSPSGVCIRRRPVATRSERIAYSLISSLVRTPLMLASISSKNSLLLRTSFFAVSGPTIRTSPPVTMFTASCGILIAFMMMVLSTPSVLSLKSFSII